MPAGGAASPRAVSCGSGGSSPGAGGKKSLAWSVGPGDRQVVQVAGEAHAAHPRGHVEHLDHLDAPRPPGVLGVLDVRDDRGVADHHGPRR